ncbi:MAG: L-glyceraldehyde 3-phosphate reductase [Chlorobi bacterium]|nr:L-glyceraldehyde 3-phosphate reductase [Chlorobiota bacterium]
MKYKADKNRYSHFEYNRCGKSGLLLPPVSLGLWHNFGFVDDFKKAEEIVTFAFDKGITHFDLANNYGPPAGSAESNFGKILKNQLAAYRDEIIVSTKAGYYMWEGPYGEWGSKKNIISSVNQSLKRLNLDYVDIFYSHRFDPNTPLEETMHTLDLIVKQGKALYVGVSNYSVENTIKAYEILKKMHTPFVIHQPKYSMLYRWVEDELLDMLEEKGLGCICFSPLAQGILTNRYLNGIPDDSRAKKKDSFLHEKDITAEILSRIKALNNIASRREQSLAQMALSWILKDKRITSVLVGASSTAQLADNLKCINSVPFTDEELSEIDQALN